MVTWIPGLLCAFALLFGSALQCAAGPFVQEDLRVPLPTSGAGDLEALLVRPNEPGRHPLALINHGSPRSSADRPTMTPLAMLPQALEFARRGWTAVILMRRGYGSSGGGWAEGYGSCTDPNYIAAGTAAAADLKAAITFLANRPDVDISRTISIGVSAGGFATVALAADAPMGLVAAINFAGGRGSLKDDEVCREDRLVEAYRIFGQRARIPMLWVYAENDRFFGPQLAEKFKDAFTGGGGDVDFVSAPAFGSDGHDLFSPAGIPVWSGFVDAFLKRHDLMLRATPLAPIPTAALAVPKVLSSNGQKAFEAYLISAPHKAFALAPDGAFGWRTGQRTIEEATAGALKLCMQNAKTCDIMFVDHAAMSKGSSEGRIAQ
jgi:dienelactone hydrolase